MIKTKLQIGDLIKFNGYAYRIRHSKLTTPNHIGLVVDIASDAAKVKWNLIAGSYDRKTMWVPFDVLDYF